MVTIRVFARKLEKDMFADFFNLSTQVYVPEFSNIRKKKIDKPCFLL